MSVYDSYSIGKVASQTMMQEMIKIISTMRVPNIGVLYLSDNDCTIWHDAPTNMTKNIALPIPTLDIAMNMTAIIKLPHNTHSADIINFKCLFLKAI